MTPTQKLAHAGRRLWGESWAAPMSEATNINPRTLQRCKADAAEGIENSAAAGCCHALAELAWQVVITLRAED